MSKWISVNDKLPKEGECVDIWIGLSDGDEGRVTDCFYDIDSGRYWRWLDHGDGKGFISDYHVSHWMPLPEPPKEGVL